MTPRAWACARACCERHADLEQLLVAERVLCDQLRERVALDELGYEIEGVVVDVGLMQRHDRRMREACGRERLTRGALAGL